MKKRIISFGVIGAGLMGREFASAAARWCHLLDLDFEPRIVAVSDPNPAALDWFARLSSSPQQLTADYHELLANTAVEAVYCAVPHNLHAEIYTDILKAGKHLLGEKPFGIDLKANQAIIKEIAEHPDVLVRCHRNFHLPQAHTASSSGRAKGALVRSSRWKPVSGIQAISIRAKA
jgi:predicted dehydrogenase